MGLFDDLFDPDDLLDANASSSVSGPGAKPDAPPPPAGVLPSPAPQSALELAAKIAQLIELGADEDSIIEMYAAFERVYPHAALPGDSQPRMARLLEDRRHRLLAIEAWRKVAGDDRDAERAAEGSVGLIRLFSQSLSTYGEAMSAIRRLHSLAPEGPWLEQTFPIGEKIRRTLDSIYPLTASGETGTAPEGPCAIVAQTCDKIPIPIVGALLASRLGLRLMDVNVALARMPGILARDLPAGEARSLAHLIQEQGKTPVVVLEESRCEPAPPAETVIEVNAVDGGMFQLETRESGVFDLDPAQIDHEKRARGMSPARRRPWGAGRFTNPAAARAHRMKSSSEASAICIFSTRRAACGWWRAKPRSGPCSAFVPTPPAPPSPRISSASSAAPATLH